MSCWANGASLYFNSPMDLTVPGRRAVGGSGVYPTLASLVGNNSASPLFNADVQTTDVISFDVRLLVAGVTPVSNDPFITLFTPMNPQSPVNLQTNPPLLLPYGNSLVPGQAYNPSYNMASGPMVFDTWTSLNDALASNIYTQWNVAGAATSIPLWNGTSGPIIQAIQITIRLWDFKTQQTREVTLVQAM